jgi:ubiquitin-conjugating enzyme E2 variant
MQIANRLPAHDEIGWRQHTWELSCIVTAAALLVWHVARLALAPSLLSWWLPLVIAAGMLSADFVSGMVHWTADTWFEETMPLLGRRFLRPFRVHHVNPDDFLRRNFIDTNGDVSMLCIPVLAATLWIPFDSVAGQTCAAYILAFCVAGVPTNQVHQWAHMPHPPRWVRWLQDRGIILSRAEHQRHHRHPYAMNYCIAIGWLNKPLTAIAFFRRLERLVTAVTGLQPRSDDTDFQAQVASEQGVVSHQG